MVLVLSLIGATGWAFAHFRSAQRFEWQREDTWMACALASMVLLQGLSVLWSQWPKQSAASALKHLHFLLWPLLVWALSRVKQPQPWMERGLLVAMGLAVLWMLLPTQIGWAGGQFEAAAQNTSVLGKIVAVLGLWGMVLASGMLRHARHAEVAERSLRWRSAMALVWGFGLLLLVAADRRIELALYVLLSLAFIMLRLFKRGQLRLALSISCAVAVLMGLALSHQAERFAKAGQEVRQYFSAPQPSLQDYSTSLGQRLEMYHIAAKAIADKPWLGWGAGSRPQYLKQYAHFPAQMFERTHFHSQYLQTLLDVGVLGSLLACAALIVAWRVSVLQLWRRGEHELAMLFASLYGVHMLSGVFNPAFSQGLSNSFFVTMAAILWVIHRQHRTGRAQSSIPI